MGRSGSKVRARAGNAGVVRASSSPHEILERPIIRRAKVEFIHFPKPGPDGEIDWLAAASKDEDAHGFDHPVGVYTLAKALDLETRRRTIIKGAFGPVSPGETIIITDGEWREQKNFPPYFYVRAIELQPPATREDLIHFLGHLPGVGPKMAEKIVDHLDNGKGLDAQTMIERIDRDPEILLQVPGVSDSRFGDEGIVERWEAIRGYERDLLFLSSLGISQQHMNRIATYFGRGGDMTEAIKRNPYVLCEVPGIPFDFADHIARKFHVFVEDPRRLAHGIEYVLNAAEGEGLVSLNRKQLMAMAPSLLGVDGLKPDVQKVRDAVDKLIADGIIISEQVNGEERLYSREQWTIETRIYSKLDKILNAEPLKQRRLRKPADSFLTDEQWGAVKRGVNSRISVLTGNPGVGKTSSLKELLDTYDKLGMNYVCLAPTGRAAKRMEEQTGRDASTIHRKLGYEGLATPRDINDESSTGKLGSLGIGIRRGKEEGTLEAEELTVDAVVVDEASMVSQRMFERLLSHVGPDTRLVFVGDADQLPPVEAGAPLLDMIASKRVPTTRLTKIFRQAEDSLLVVNAHRIKDGKAPVTKREAEKELGHKLKEDFRIVDTSQETVIDDIHREVEKIAKQMRVDETEVMVVAPLKAGDAGVHSLNRALQAKHNPDGEPVFENDEQQFRIGDIVMNTKNRYVSQRQSENGMHDIFNGDIGRIIAQDEETKEVLVDFGHGEQSYGTWELPNLDLAYCSTTHKMQGSEAPAVVYVVPPGGTDRLTRQNIYTGITRAKQRCVVLADRKTLERGITVDASIRDQQLQLDKNRLSDLNHERAAAFEEQQARYADYADRQLIPAPDDHVRAEDAELALA